MEHQPTEAEIELARSFVEAASSPDLSDAYLAAANAIISIQEQREAAQQANPHTWAALAYLAGTVE